MRMELYRLLKSRRSLLVIAAIFLLPLVDLGFNLYQVYYHYWSSNDWPTKAYVLQPAYASFLSGSSGGHFTQMLLIWMLPFHLLLMYADYPIQDKAQGLSEIFQTKLKKWKLLMTRYLFAFLLTFTTLLLSVLLNYGLSLILFQGGTSFQGMEEELNIATSFEKYALTHANTVYLIYALAFPFIAAVYAVFCVSLSALLQKNKYVYPAAFIIWILLIASKYSIIDAIQPFSEFGIKEGLLAIMLLLLVVLISVPTITLYKVKADEL